MCKQFSQLPSGQAPVLLACKEILKQYIQSLLVEAFCSLWLYVHSQRVGSLTFP